ncbi:uncharacterized protein EMH_0020680 [Eimeria mitis]|uniref:Uncharacterized protein n=1 Tax=Eimeria mitis TaxID=44415 RepID=U6JZ35_9EIME|nr:uncharacterized protein EMH_0020680 [Eimeria mitis]CDJ29312.1 hypothetical protein, conserved [Eimeria mitis]
MREQRADLTPVEEAGLVVLDRASEGSKKDARTAGRSAAVSRRALDLVVVVAVGLALTLMIISCFRHINSRRTLQEFSWRQLAGDQEDGGRDSSCTGGLDSDESGQELPQQDGQEVPMEVGEDEPQQQGGSMGGTPEVDDQPQQEESEEPEQKLPQQDGEGMQMELGEDGQQEQGGSMGGAPGGDGQRQQEESKGVDAGSQSPPEEKEKSGPPTPAPAEAAGDMPLELPGTSSGESGTSTPRPSGKRKAKTKHLELPVKVRAPAMGKKGEEDDSSDSGDELPTRWPTGKLYDPDPSKLPPAKPRKQPPPLPKLGPVTVPGDRPVSKSPRAQAAKVKGLTKILQKAWEHAEEESGRSSEGYMKSAVSLVAEVAQALSAQIGSARQLISEDSSGELEEVCGLAEGLLAVVDEFLASHGVTRGDFPPQPPVGEGPGHPIPNRLLAMTLAQTRLSRAIEDFKADPNFDKFPQLNKFVDMADTLITSTEPLPPQLRAQGRSAAARFIEEFLNEVIRLADEMEELLSMYGGEDRPPSPGLVMDTMFGALDASMQRLGAILGQQQGQQQQGQQQRGGARSRRRREGEDHGEDDPEGKEREP